MSENRSNVIVRVSNLSKTFRRGDGNLVKAIDSTSLEVHEGEFVVLLGPSGCGKTTLLRCVAGLEEPNRGEIEIGETVVYSAPRSINIAPDKRGLSMIFQSYALWPHMSVFRNVAYPLETQRPRLSKQAMRDKVNEVLELVGIPELGSQYPTQLSGGQQQRVALARALVGGSRLVLFDEPLSNVDAKVREQLRGELGRMQRELGFSALYVTHDQAEAMQLGDRIAVIGHGVMRQLGTPGEIYDEPESRYVANFIGTSNEVTGRVTAVDGDVVTADTAIGPITGVAPHSTVIGDEIVALWRPERTMVREAAPKVKQNWWPVKLESTMYVGTHAEQVYRAGSLELRRWVMPNDGRQPGDTVWIGATPEAVRILADEHVGPLPETLPEPDQETVAGSLVTTAEPIEQIPVAP